MSELKPMTAHRAIYFMERFKKEEKLLGPNEQAAVDYVIAMLEAQDAQPAQAVPLLSEDELLMMWAGDQPRPTLGKNKVLTYARAIEQAVRAKLGVVQWLPIETAPKGQRVMVWIADKEAGENIAFAKVWFHADGTLGGGAEGFNGKWDLTHWMPLPPPPIAGKEGDNVLE